MIKIKIFVFNPFQENTFVLSDETSECIIVDPGCYSLQEKNALDDYITSNTLKPVKIISTHGHVDHVLGTRHLVSKYSVPFEIHENDQQLLNDAQKLGVAFGFNVEEPPSVSSYLLENTNVEFGESKLQILHVPGHSPGSVALFCAEQKFVIVGDVLFKGSIGRTDLPGGSYDMLMKSIFSKLMTLPEDTEVFPGHGPATTIHDEALSNPFLA